MRRAIRMVLVLGLASWAALAAPAADANDGRRAGFRPPPASVFPAPRDPWRSWGVRRTPHSHTPHIRTPHAGHPAPHFVAPRPFRVWVPGQWAWSGVQWVWAPGHWAAAH